MRSAIISTAALLASATLAQAEVKPFNVYTMQVLDMRIPYVQHNISFNVNAPNNTYEDGGDNFGLCSFGWKDGAPQCWKKCESQATNTSASNPSSTYYARLDEYNGPDTFNISIWQGYDGGHNTGLIQIRSGQDGYYCSHGAQTTQCSIGFPFTPIEVPATKTDGQCEPNDFPLCGASI